MLQKGILLPLRDHCEVLCWRHLILKTMKYAGFLGSNEVGRQGSMPYVRFTSVSQAASFSYEKARQVVYGRSNGEINLEDNADAYIDPDFVDMEQYDEPDQDHEENPSTPGFGSSPFSTVNTPSSYTTNHTDRVDHLPLSDPTPEELNSIFLSLISQGFLRGFVSHHVDLLQSRFAIPGVRAKAADPSLSPNAWREVGFPDIFGVVRQTEEALMDGSWDVPGWVTEEKVRAREAAGGGAGGGRVVHLKASDVRPVGMS